MGVQRENNPVKTSMEMVVTLENGDVYTIPTVELNNNHRGGQPDDSFPVAPW
ncbi:hypothetical protein JSO54_08720 [Riemerella anatipestifer]|uniref:hypothetical protein n=1 Tax=Riemerella anatipestifer TaxID=34085 RepID=UPI0013750EA6|nr:hypothetical protein [Riemerella anatipestifer]MDY3339408.1 hypothetical protein [Riemerella anatipestifer]